MKFSVDRDALLRPLQAVSGVVEKRHTVPVLANVLLEIDDGRMTLVATDTEVELSAGGDVTEGDAGTLTVPARKLLDICKSLVPGSSVRCSFQGTMLSVSSGRSRFSLATLPPDDFPRSDLPEGGVRFAMAQSELKTLLERTAFAMAQQDVRYYLNGMLLEVGDGQVRAVATDGHRLSLAECAVESVAGEPRQVIVPRKGVNELVRILEREDAADIVLGGNAIRVATPSTVLTSKLIDGRFPDYTRVIPREEECDKSLDLDRDEFRQCLSRAAILSNDKYRAVRLSLTGGTLRVSANNPEEEAAEDEIEVDYGGEGLEIGFNVGYMIDALNAIRSERVRLFMKDASSSCLVMPGDSDQSRYVVMPMRL